MAGTIPPNFPSSNDQLIVGTIQYFPTIEPNSASISESFIVDVGVWHVEPTRPPFYFPPSHSLPYRLGRGATRITSIDLRSDPHNKHRSAERSAIQASICGAIRNISIDPLPGSRQAAMPESGSGLETDPTRAGYAACAPSGLLGRSISCTAASSRTPRQMQHRYNGSNLLSVASPSEVQRRGDA